MMRDEEASKLEALASSTLADVRNKAALSLYTHSQRSDE
jgi:hypothetical protein